MGLFKSKAQEEWKVNYIREFNEEILNSLLSTNMIKKASINNITKNMLIYYDNTKLDITLDPKLDPKANAQKYYRKSRN